MRFLQVNNVRPSKKVRRQSGRETPNSTIKVPKQQIIDACLEPVEEWSDWNDYRDGLRRRGDKTLIGGAHPAYNYNSKKTKKNDKRLKKFEKIRTARKNSPRNR